MPIKFWNSHAEPIHLLQIIMSREPHAPKTTHEHLTSTALQIISGIIDLHLMLEKRSGHSSVLISPATMVSP